MHLSRHLLDAAARGEIPRDALERIVREHLAALCPTCAQALGAHDAGSPIPSADRRDHLRRRLGLRALGFRAHEKEARAWVRRVLRLDPGERRDKVGSAYVRYRGPLFCLLLLEEARGQIPADPAEAESLADAVLASNQKTAVYEPDPEVECAALAVRGNARRACGRLLAAEADLTQALDLLDALGVTDPETPAEVLSYVGSLRKDQGRLEEATLHLQRSATLYRLLHDRERAARVLLNLAAVQYERHQFAAAVTVTEAALDLLDAGSPDWLRGYAHFNLALQLHAAGDVDRAEAELEEHGELLARCGEEVAQHAVWLQARIAWSREDLGPAERLYREARERAVARGIAWDAGLVGLELALVHLARGRTAQVRKLAREALKIFAEQQVERETRAALDLLDAAARRDAFTRKVLETVIAAVERASRGLC